jgi:hypothetical protein
MPSGTLTLESLRVGDHIYLGDALVAQETQLIFAHIGGYRTLERAQMASLDLTGASIQGELCLGKLDKDKPQ